MAASIKNENINPSTRHYPRKKNVEKSSDILQNSVITKLLNKKEPLMKQGGFETFILCLNCYIYIVGTAPLPPPPLIKGGAGTSKI